MKKCVIIYNTKSGKIKPKQLINKFYKVIIENGYSLDVITTKRKGHAINIVEELPDDIDLVISAGGDGTFDEVITGNMHRKKKLLIAQLPLGTCNDVGTMYGLTSDIEKDLYSILNGVKKNIDIIMINDEPFVYAAAFGNFINITFDTPKRWKEIFGRLAYILFGFTEINEKIRINHIKYKVNGKEKEGDFSFIFITNSSRVGGIDDVFPDTKLDDSKFEVLLCNIKNKADIFKSLLYVKNNGVYNVPGCEYYSTDKLELEFDHVVEHSWGLDGEEYNSKTDKFVFTVNKDITVLLPETNVDKLFVNKEGE